MRKIFLFAFSLLVFSSSLQAGGYQVSLHGQKQIGMGLVGTSIAFDASSIFYNPGGLSFVTKAYNISAGISPLKSYTVFRKEAPSLYEGETDNGWGTPFYFYASAKINDKLSAGLSVNTPYGNSLKWEDGWDGRYLIEELSLKAIFFQPTLSYKINDYIGIGAGLVYATGDVELQKALPLEGAGIDGSVNISGTTASFGYNLGLFIRPLAELNIGINYRSEILMEVDDGDAKFDLPESLATSFPDTKVKTELPLPANLDFGMSYQFSEKLLVGFSINYVFWNTYDSLVFDFKDNTSSLSDSRSPREYKNTIIYRIGGQYELNSLFTFRLGAYYDPSPVNEKYFSPETPSLNNLGLTAGFSLQAMKNLSLDMSFLYLMGMENDVSYEPDNFGGTYKSRIYIPGFGLSYSF